MIENPTTSARYRYIRCLRNRQRLLRSFLTDDVLREMVVQLPSQRCLWAGGEPTSLGVLTAMAELHRSVSPGDRWIRVRIRESMVTGVNTSSRAQRNVNIEMYVSTRLLYSRLYSAGAVRHTEVEVGSVAGNREKPGAPHVTSVTLVSSLLDSQPLPPVLPPSFCSPHPHSSVDCAERYNSQSLVFPSALPRFLV